MRTLSVAVCVCGRPSRPTTTRPQSAVACKQLTLHDPMQRALAGCHRRQRHPWSLRTASRCLGSLIFQCSKRLCVLKYNRIMVFVAYYLSSFRNSNERPNHTQSFHDHLVRRPTTGFCVGWVTKPLFVRSPDTSTTNASRSGVPLLLLGTTFTIQPGTKTPGARQSPPGLAAPASPATLAAVALAPALSASVIATLEDAHRVDAADATSGSLKDDAGPLAPLRKKQYPRGLKRLRDRLQVLDVRLRLDVNALKQQISDLQLHSTLLANKIKIQQPRRGKEHAVETVAEYFGAFQLGSMLPLDTRGEDPLSRYHSSSASGQSHSNGHAAIDQDETKHTVRSYLEDQSFEPERLRLFEDRQHQFLMTALDPTMQTAGQKDGVRVFVERWKNFSRCHGVARLELTSMSCHGSEEEPIVIAHGLWSGYITTAQLPELYPAVLMDSLLEKNIVGTHIQYPSREVFHFNAEGRVILYDVDLDLVCALHQAIGNLCDVERAMRR